MLNRKEWFLSEEVLALFPVLDQVKAGQIEMTRELMCQVIESMYTFPIVSPFRTWDETFEIFLAEMEWRDLWAKAAKAEWLDIFVQFMLDCPSKLPPEEAQEGFTNDFVFLLGSIAHRFPDKSTELLLALLQNDEIRTWIIDTLDISQRFDSDEQNIEAWLNE